MSPSTSSTQSKEKEVPERESFEVWLHVDQSGRGADKASLLQGCSAVSGSASDGGQRLLALFSHRCKVGLSAGLGIFVILCSTSGFFPHQVAVCEAARVTLGGAAHQRLGQ